MNTEIEILKISKIRRELNYCPDFAAIRWPKGATDYLTSYARNDSLIIVGRHVNGWTSGVKRRGVESWNLFCTLPGFSSTIIWCRVAGTDKENPHELANRILAAAGIGSIPINNPPT
jgi:hypothetical protein